VDIQFFKFYAHNRNFPGVIHSVVCIMTGPKRLRKRVLQTVRSTVSSFNLQYPLISLRSSSICLRLLPSLPTSSILPSIYPSIMCFRRQFQSTTPPIQVAFLLITVCRSSLCSWTPCNISDPLKVSLVITNCFVLANRSSI